MHEWSEDTEGRHVVGIIYYSVSISALHVPSQHYTCTGARLALTHVYTMIVFNQLQSCLVVADSLEAVNVMSSACLLKCIFIASLFHLWSHYVSGEYNVRLENRVSLVQVPPEAAHFLWHVLSMLSS